MLRYSIGILHPKIIYSQRFRTTLDAAVVLLSCINNTGYRIAGCGINHSQLFHTAQDDAVWMMIAHCHTTG